MDDDFRRAQSPAGLVAAAEAVELVERDGTPVPASVRAELDLTMQLDLRAVKSLRRTAALRNVFDQVDSSGDGRVDLAELTHAVDELLGMGGQPEDVRRLFAEVDADGSGFIDFDEFLAFFKGLKQANLASVGRAWEAGDRLRALFTEREQGGRVGADTAAAMLLEVGVALAERELRDVVRTEPELTWPALERVRSEANLRAVFRQLDATGDGEVELAELRDALEALAVKVTDAQLAAMIREVDTDGSGAIDYEEFKRFFGHLKHASLHNVAKAWLSMSGVDVGSDLGGGGPPPADMPLWQFVLAGGMGGVASRTATSPLERAKLLAQTQARPMSLRQIAAQQGVRGLWQGNLANCLRVFPMGGIVCLSYGQINKLLPTDNELDPMEPVYRAAAGGLAGALGATLTHPLDVVRARIMTSGGAGGIWAALQALHAERGLWRGLGPTLIAIAPFVAIQQASYDTMRIGAVNHAGLEPTVPLFLALGAAAGTTAQLVVYPMDLVRRRLQVMRAEGGTVLGVLRAVQGEFGVRGLFAGVGATVAKVAPSVAVSLVVRDWILGRTS